MQDVTPEASLFSFSRSDLVFKLSCRLSFTLSSPPASPAREQWRAGEKGKKQQKNPEHPACPVAPEDGTGINPV